MKFEGIIHLFDGSKLYIGEALSRTLRGKKVLVKEREVGKVVDARVEEAGVVVDLEVDPETASKLQLGAGVSIGFDPEIKLIEKRCCMCSNKFTAEEGSINVCDGCAENG